MVRKVSTDKLSDDNKVQVPKGFDLKNDNLLTRDNEIATEDSQVTTNEGGKDNDSVARKELDTRKELESQDKLGNFEIQDLMSDYKNDTQH